MLEHMFIGDPPGNHDRILDFSTAVTGSLFFVPTATFLDDLPPAPARTEAAPVPVASTAEAVTTTAEGSLGIGGLRVGG